MEDLETEASLNTKEKRLDALLRAVPGHLSTMTVDRMLTEVSELGVELEADPTQPHLGTKYLQDILARCRQHLNRSHLYLQQLRIYEKGIRLKLKERELDLDLKVKGLLADDALVRKQPSIEDRKALASSMLLAEHEDLAGLRVSQLDVDNAVKLVKSAYDHLNRTSQDIRLQRQLVRDDKDVDGGGNGVGGGLTRPSPKPDGTLPDGMPPLASDAPPDPRDLLDESKRPDDMPKPMNASHAQLMTNFLHSHPVIAAPKTPGPRAAPSSVIPVPDPGGDVAMARVSYSDLLK